VTINPSEVQPGQKFVLNFEIENDLGEDIEKVFIILDLEPIISPVTGQVIYQPPFSPYQSSNKVTLKEIGEGDDEKVGFDLIVFPDATSGTYNIPVKVSYTETNTGNLEKDVSLGVVSIIVNAKPKMDLSSEENVLIKGRSGKIKIRVINSGLGEAKFLSISVNQIVGIRMTNSNQVYIGNIDSNDFDTADFSVFTNANAPSTINLPVQITYTDSQNKQITENKIIPIKTYTEKEAVELGLIKRNNTFLIIFIFLIVVILFFIYRRIKKRRKNKRNGQ